MSNDTRTLLSIDEFGFAFESWNEKGMAEFTERPVMGNLPHRGVWADGCKIRPIVLG